MNMRKLLCGICIMGLAAGTLWGRGIDAPSALVVLPARQRVVDFGFDLMRWQSVSLIAYQQVGPELLVHLWNGREWVPMTAAAYFSGNFLLGAPEQIILVGDDRLLPPMFQTVPDWCSKIKRLRTFDISSLVNEFGSLLKFDDAQWKWFAEKYGLTLTDSNANRRRWGKYGPPGNEWYRQQPPPSEKILSMPQPVLPTESVESVVLPSQVIPDNVPVPVAPLQTTPAITPVPPVETTPPVMNATIPVPIAQAPAPVAEPVPDVSTPPAAIAPEAPVTPVAPRESATDVLPPGTTVELPGK